MAIELEGGKLKLPMKTACTSRNQGRQIVLVIEHWAIEDERLVQTAQIIANNSTGSNLTPNTHGNRAHH
jgi:hypothetical protein